MYRWSGAVSVLLRMFFADEDVPHELVFADGLANVGNRSQQSKVAALARWKKAAVEKALRTLDIAGSALAVCTGQARMRGCAFKANAFKQKKPRQCIDVVGEGIQSRCSA
jgi:hypothetical protein